MFFALCYIGMKFLLQKFSFFSIILHDKIKFDQGSEICGIKKSIFVECNANSN